VRATPLRAALLWSDCAARRPGAPSAPGEPMGIALSHASIRCSREGAAAAWGPVAWSPQR
jgi:hypothetical protein